MRATIGLMFFLFLKDIHFFAKDFAAQKFCCDFCRDIYLISQSLNVEISILAKCCNTSSSGIQNHHIVDHLS